MKGDELTLRQMSSSQIDALGTAIFKWEEVTINNNRIDEQIFAARM